MAAALTVVVIALAPAGRRRAAAAGGGSLPALAGGGYWYLRNLIATGNPLPQVEHLGPIGLPHPERLQSGRPDHSILHYATDTGIWREYFGPGLDNAFGALWPVVVARRRRRRRSSPSLWGRERVLRGIGAVALFGMAAYLVTPLGAAGAEGEPVGFAINIRFVLPALLAGAALLPLAPILEGRRRQWVALGVLLAVLVVTDRADTVLRDPSRLVRAAGRGARCPDPRRPDLCPGAASGAAGRGRRRLRRAGTGRRRDRLPGPAPLPRRSLRGRLGHPGDGPRPRLCAGPATPPTPGSASSASTAGFLGYGFYGTDLSNDVQYLGARGPHGAFNAIPTCAEFRAAVNEADLDYLVTAPFLNYIHTEHPVPSPEAGWLRGEPAVKPVDRNGGGHRLAGERAASTRAACGPENAPLRRIPQQPCLLTGAAG